MEKLDTAFELFDAFNRQDPATIYQEGAAYPAAYFYALQLHHWVKKLEPGAGEELLLASRSQHIGRWLIPREQYPAGKPGYLKWRTDLAAFHAVKAGALMLQAGYNAAQVHAVQRIIRKEQLRTDPAVQVMENALCLVFLEFQYDDFLAKHDDGKVIRILQKTWGKMTAPGRSAALTLPFAGKAKVLIEQALNI